MPRVAKSPKGLSSAIVPIRDQAVAPTGASQALNLRQFLYEQEFGGVEEKGSHLLISVRAG